MKRLTTPNKRQVINSPRPAIQKKGKKTQYQKKKNKTQQTQLIE